MKNSKQPIFPCPDSGCLAVTGEQWFADRLSITVPNPGKPLFLWILLIIDQGSLLPRGAFCTDKTDLFSMISLVERTADRYGTPESIYVDLGPLSARQEFLDYLDRKGIRPQGLGELRRGCGGYTERFMESLRSYIWTAACEGPCLTAEDITAWLDRYLDCFFARQSEMHEERRRFLA